MLKLAGIEYERAICLVRFFRVHAGRFQYVGDSSGCAALATGYLLTPLSGLITSETCVPLSGRVMASHALWAGRP